MQSLRLIAPATEPAGNGLAKLDAFEARTLEQCEVTIERGRMVFMDVLEAFRKIKEGKLYRATDGTFEAYCRRRWDITARRGRQLLAAAETIEELKAPDAQGRTPVVLPTSERQTRALAGLTPDEKRKVWQAAVETRADGVPTTMGIEQAAAVVKESKIQSSKFKVQGPKSEGESPRAEVEARQKTAGDGLETPTAKERRVRDMLGDLIKQARNLLDEIGSGEAGGFLSNAVYHLECAARQVERVARLRQARNTGRRVGDNGADREGTKRTERTQATKGQGALVICREMVGAGPHTPRCRYRSERGGWVEDPSGAQVFATIQEANKAWCSTHADKVMQMAKAQWRYKYEF